MLLTLQWLECWQWVRFWQSISEFDSGRVYQPFFIKCIQLWLSKLFHAKTGLSDFRGCDVFNCNTVKRFNGPIKWCEYLEVFLYLHAIACILTILLWTELSLWVLILAGEASLWRIALLSPTLSICRVCADMCALKLNGRVPLERVVLVIPIFADNATSFLPGRAYHSTTPDYYQGR